MQAIIVREFGSADQLSLVELPDPVAGKGQVLIKVEAAGIGLVDVMQRQGYLGVTAAGFVPGIEVAGVVASVGADVDPGLIGRRVYAQGRGGYAGQFLAEARRVVPLPEGLSAEEAVALGVNALVAHFSLERARLRAGETVLVRGASGGIGALAARMAVLSGAEVTAVTHADAASRVEALGVRQVVRRGLDPQPEGPFDVIIDPVAGAAVPGFIATLAPNGRYVINGAAAGIPPDGVGDALLGAFAASPSYSLLSLDSVPVADLVSATAAILGQAAEARIRPIIAEILPLRDAARAHKMLESGKSFGKLLLRP